MKLAWPEIQKRGSLRCGSMDSGLSAGGSDGAATVGVVWAFCVAAVDGESGCCAWTNGAVPVMAPRVRASAKMLLLTLRSARAVSLTTNCFELGLNSTRVLTSQATQKRLQKGYSAPRLL